MIEKQNVERFFALGQEYPTADAAKTAVIAAILSDGPTTEAASKIAELIMLDFKDPIGKGGATEAASKIAELIMSKKDEILEVLSDVPKLRKRAKRKAKAAPVPEAAKPPANFQPVE